MKSQQMKALFTCIQVEAKLAPASQFDSNSGQGATTSSPPPTVLAQPLPVLLRPVMCVPCDVYACD